MWRKYRPDAIDRALFVCYDSCISTRRCVHCPKSSGERQSCCSDRRYSYTLHISNCLYLRHRCRSEAMNACPCNGVGVFLHIPAFQRGEHAMTQVEPLTVRACPECGKELSEQNGTLHCEEHGDFFSYGPQLLVHCASQTPISAIPMLMPWERLGD